MGFPEPEDVGKMESIAVLVGQAVDVADIVTLRDGTLAVVTTSGKLYECDNDWASAGATFIQANLNSNSADFMRVNVVEEHGKAGFRPAEQ